MDPLTIAALASGALGAATSGQGQQDPKNAGDLHLANIGQQNLWNMMQQRAMSGSGDFGFGANVKQGKSQLQQMMGDRGISPQGGAGMNALSQMIGTASAADAQGRNDYAMNVLRSPMQVVSTEGSNWLPNSPSFGYDNEQQWQRFGRFRRQNNFNPLQAGQNLAATSQQAAPPVDPAAGYMPRAAGMFGRGA